jgi:HTH-type transcriptional regulator/antitoxin HipB
MYMAEVGARIRQTRKARGLTQAALASRAGIARETLNQFESGTARDLGFAKILRLLRVLGLEILLLEKPGEAATDYVALAASAGSTGFRESLTQEELVRALLSGQAPARKGPHLRRLLEDSPPQVVQRLVAQVAAWTKPGRVEKNLEALAKKLDVQPRREWTNPD